MRGPLAALNFHMLGHMPDGQYPFGGPVGMLVHDGLERWWSAQDEEVGQGVRYIS